MIVARRPPNALVAPKPASSLQSITLYRRTTAAQSGRSQEGADIQRRIQRELGGGVVCIRLKIQRGRGSCLAVATRPRVEAFAWRLSFAEADADGSKTQITQPHAPRRQSALLSCSRSMGANFLMAIDFSAPRSRLGSLGQSPKRCRRCARWASASATGRAASIHRR
jgi:hypothetical protein